MKRFLFIIIVVLPIALMALPTMAQQIAPNPTATTVPDSDGDGLLDPDDQCPSVPGPRENGGCPLPTAVPDSDGDGLLDPDDQCPSVPGPRENGGCPPVVDPTAPVPTTIPDSDGDGVLDPNDSCPTVSGPRENGGCPPVVDPTAPVPTTIPDSDGDGVLDPNDGCPAQPGPANLSGCPDTTVDSDGDTIPDVVDECPHVAGTLNNGCQPITTTSSTPAPFTVPLLPTDGCYVTPNGDYQVFVRDHPDALAPVLGHLLPGKVYEAGGYVLNGADVWLVLKEYEGSTGTTGYAASSVIAYTSLCSTAVVVSPAGEFPWQVSLQGIGDEQPATFEYCVLEEVGEAGIYKEFCYEIEIPDGCIVVASEAGVFKIECGDGVVGTINPAIGELPAIDLQVPTRGGDTPIAINLQIIYYAGKDCNNNGIDDLDEFWPPDCIGQLTTDTGDSSEEPVYLDYGIGALQICQPGQIFQVYPSRPDDPICINPIDDLLGDGRIEEVGAVLVGVVPNDEPAQVPIDVWEDFLAGHCYPQNWWSSVDNDGNVSGGCWKQDEAEENKGTQLGLIMRGDDPVVDKLVAVVGDSTVADTSLDKICPGEIAFFTWLEDDDGNVIPGSTDVECLPPDFFD